MKKLTLNLIGIFLGASAYAANDMPGSDPANCSLRNGSERNEKRDPQSLVSTYLKGPSKTPKQRQNNVETNSSTGG